LAKGLHEKKGSFFDGGETIIEEMARFKLSLLSAAKRRSSYKFINVKMEAKVGV